MPTYDYECNGCQHRFELFQRFDEKVKRTCPECKKRKLVRLIGTGGGVIFKGSGFYETDYRSSEYKRRESEDKKPAEAKDSGKKTDSSSKKSVEKKESGKKPDVGSGASD